MKALRNFDPFADGGDVDEGFELYVLSLDTGEHEEYHWIGKRE